MKHGIVKPMQCAMLAAACLLGPAGMAADEAEVIRLSEPVEQTEAYETFGAPLDQSVSKVALADIASDGDRFLDGEQFPLAHIPADDGFEFSRHD